MIFAIILSIIFLAASIYNLTQGVYDEAGAALAISFVLAGLFFFDRYQERALKNFLIWLIENKERLKNNKREVLMWNNIPVKYDSEITQYYFCVSFLIATFKQPTGFLFDDSSNKLFANFVTTTLTLVMGWWGFPWGPIYTVQTIFRNLRGGTKTSIGLLISELENATQGLE